MMTTLTSYVRHFCDDRSHRSRSLPTMLPRRCGVLRPVSTMATILRLAAVLSLVGMITVALPRDAAALPFRIDETAVAPVHPRLASRNVSSLHGPSLELHPAAESASQPVDEADASDGDCCTLTSGVRNCDQVFVINSRSIGTCCDPEVLMSGLRCETYAPCDSGGCRTWQPADLMSTLTAYDPSVVTVIYVHGNQISPGKAKCRGLLAYRRLYECSNPDQPIRLIIFSWPSSEIKGRLKDARVKAARTRPAGCQLAWIIDQIPGDVPLSLLGYSYGPRIITGALHILGGGTLNGLGLAERANPHREPVRVVLVASALHANWLGPGQYHGLAMTQVESMLLVNNCKDMAMRLYHLSCPNGSPQALGLRGPTCIGSERHKIRCIDVSRYVGSEHDEVRYSCVPGTPCRYWGNLVE